MANATATELQQLYIAYFGRAADPSGLDYWTDNGITTKAFAANMYAQKEFKSVYGDLTVEAQVNQIYQNLFDRDADATGLLYWTAQINNGNLAIASIANDLIWAANNNSGSSDDKTALTNKTDGAVAYTAKVRETTSGILAYAPASSDPWVAGSNIEAAVTYFQGIDKDTPHTTSGIASSVSTIISNGVQSASSKTLTLDIGLNNLTGGTASDTFDATVSNSLNTGDTLTGGTGTDTLSANFATTHTATVNSTGIETFSLTAAAVTTLNFADVSDLTTLTSQGSTAALTINNLKSLPTININTNEEASTFNFANTAMSGTADDLQINLDGVKDSDNGSDSKSSITLTSAAGATNTIETVSLASNSVANKIEILSTTGVGATKLEITGDQALTIRDTLNTEIATVDASSATGALTFTTGNAIAATITLNGSSTTGGTVTTSSAADTITGVAGGDTIDAAGGANSITAVSGANHITTTGGKDTIVGGSGADTILAGGEADSITGGAGNDSITSAAGSDIVVAGTGDDYVTESGTGDENIDLGAGDDSIEMAYGDLTTADTIAGGAGSDTLILTGTTSDNLDVDFTNVTGIKTLANKATTEELNVTLGTEAAEAGIDTINITSVDQDELITFDADFTNDLTINLLSTAAAADHDAFDMAGAGYTNKITLNIGTTDLAAAQTITAGSGTTDVLLFSSTANTAHAHMASVTAFETIKASAGASASWQLANEGHADGKNIHLDGSALTSAFVATLDASDELDAIVSITGGAGNDVITIGESDLGQVVDGGAGNDTIHVTDMTKLTTLDTISGGTGTNTLSFVAQDTSIADADFTNITNIQILTAGTGIAFGKDDGTEDVTLGTEAAEAGISTITFAGTSENSFVNLAAGFTNNVTVNLNDAEDNILASAYTKVLTVNTAALTATANTVITGGTGTSDEILYTGTGLGGTISGISAIEKITVNSDANATLVLAQGNVIAGQTLTINSSAITTATKTFTANLSAESTATGKIVVIGSAGVDTITISQLNDSIATGGADDVIKVSGAYITTDDTIDGGAGNDKIVAAADLTLADGTFTNVSNFEILEGTSNGTSDFIITGTLGADASSAGLTTINFLHDDAEGDALTIGSGFASDFTVDFDGTHENVLDASATSKAATIVATLAEMDNGANGVHSITGGSGTGDKLNLTVTAATAVAAADTAGIAGVETWTITDGETDAARSFSVTLSDVNAAWTDANNYDVLTIDASAITADTVAIDATNEIDAQVKIFGGGVADTLTASLSVNLGDSITGGAGNDTLVFDDAHLRSNDTVDGGAGTDTISFTGDLAAGVVTDADFTNVSNVEVLSSAGDFLSLTLGSEAADAGITSIDLGSDDAAAGITIASGFTNDFSIEIDTHNHDAIDSTATSANVTYNIAAADLLDADVNFDAGTGTSDEIKLTADADSTGTVLTQISGFEKITLVADSTKSAIITMGDNDTQIAAGKTLTVDLSAGGGYANFIGSESELDGSLVITASGTASTLTGAGGADTITGGAGADSISGGSGADSLSGGAAADTITGGAGADTLVGGDGSDLFVFSTLAADSSDTITDFVSADDSIQITADYSGLNNAIDVNAALVASSGAAGTTAVEALLTGKRLEWAYDTTNSKLIIETGTNQAISGADWQLGVNAAATAGSTFASADVNFDITGTGAADTITLDTSSHTVDAGLGADTIIAGAGTHNIQGGGGADSITAASGGVMTIAGGAGVDVITLKDETTNTIQTINVAEGDQAIITTVIDAKTTSVNTDVLGYSGGITTVANFEGGAGKDIVNLAGFDASATSAVYANLGALTWASVTDDGGYIVYGTHGATSFTAATAFDAANSHDALCFVANGANNTGVNAATEMIVLLDLDAALVATNMI